MTPPEGWRAAWPILRAQVKPYHAWIGLAGFLLTALGTLAIAGVLLASLWRNPQVLAGRWHEPVLLLLLLIAVNAFWFFVWRVYRRIAAENEMLRRGRMA